MSEAKQLSAAQMVRVTAENLNEMLIQMAAHIEALEKRIAEMELQIGNNTPAQ